MNNPVVLARSIAVTALGNDLDGLWQGLLDGRRGIAALDRFSCANYISALGGCIDGLAAAPGSLFQALLERVAEQLGPLPQDCRLLVASTKGEVDLLQQQRGDLRPELLFENLLATIAARLGLSDRGMNINAACASSTVAVARAAALIAAGQAEAVLVFAADVLSEFVFSGFSALQALSAQPCRPFDRQRNGLNLGEAGVALLLLSADRARREGLAPLATVRGWGVANDAFHVTAPARDGRGLIRACQQALQQAEINPEQVAAVNAHGTATVYNDAMELTAFAAVFDGRIPPLHGIKGSIGHCLGAAGGVEIAIAARSLLEQRIPGTVGCATPEELAGDAISTAVRAISGDYLLCSNSGFGGINGVVILGRGAL
ncbi:beta-ketoacyl synthase N-terminal-like domain-containing protein [Pelobacter seleniigenes]|uniref:beta-ketoacyl synthase N-terminal-like domain-containing protein n=1 Tax=Pelobacter seleniigenes TaxID=407188 RepID=UPI0004A6DD28|nr:beta-ketoacyl synthase N-terminal-like domain-containing protein [Pelobacter seleniigenes]